MTTKVQAIYRDGAFFPAVPVAVAEGTQVELTVVVGESVADALEAMAGLPMEGPVDGFSGTEHDRVLYGEHREK